MASERRRRRRKEKKDSSKPKTKKAPRQHDEQLVSTAESTSTSMHDVPDHLLELILLRLRSSACLLRAAAACKHWRRVIAGADFLSRCLHASSCVAGHYHDWVADYGSPPVTGSPVFVPSDSSLAVDRRRFSLDDDDDLLPASDTGWVLTDSRGSLLLLSKRTTTGWRRDTGWRADIHSHSFPDVVVCEPLTRRRQGILRPEPEEHHATCLLGVFLLDGCHGHIGMSEFRLVAVLHEDHVSENGRAMPVACVFSLGSDGGGWRVLPNESTDSAAVSLPGVIERTSFAGRANGCLYWVVEEEDDGAAAMMVLDEAAMNFSRVPLNLGENEGDSHDGNHYDRWSFRVIGGGEDDGVLRVVRLVRNELRVLARREGTDEWVVEGHVRLREATLGMPGREERFFQRDAMVVVAHEGYVVVTPQEKTWLFSVDLETMEVEREHERNRYAGPAFPSELPWPPTFMAACGSRRERGSRRRGSCP
ncbi:hypothetical protein HU200_029037 [Digitaria exilis]|uniref:F-box domain-containing protein n=1 Tax=Digitaria exilis TaxID=1010633 RepID=A0A835ESA2_9POAL|nr:hypothetical protein HU200_029037 [Digitaria exilis]CAB3456817.1 unnamed protein product [Digitaria exilis]